MKSPWRLPGFLVVSLVSPLACVPACDPLRRSSSTVAPSVVGGLSIDPRSVGAPAVTSTFVPGATLLPAQLEATPILEDPALAAVATAVQLADYERAAAALEPLVAARAEGSLEQARGFYQLGRLQNLAKNDAAAARAYAVAARTSWPLSVYAAHGVMQASVRSGNQAEALRFWNETKWNDAPIVTSARLLAAEAYEKRGELGAAVPLWTAHLQSGRKPARWVDVTVRLARARLLLTPDPDTAHDVLTLLRRVLIEAPTGTLGTQAADLERRALAVLPASERQRRSVFSNSERLARAQGLCDTQHLSEADRLLHELEVGLSPEERAGELGCRVVSLAAQVKGKKKDRAASADLFGEAMTRCHGDALVTVLFQGGKASASAGRPTEALERFTRVERETPTHRLADDARLRGAEAAFELGDEARFTSMLERMAEDFPEGDMVSDGLLRLSLFRIDRGDWAGALGPLEVAQRARPRERAVNTAGRTPYFHARALLALGERPRGLAELRAVIANYPLSYYMLLAYTRLAEADAMGAARALAEASLQEGPTEVPIPDHPLFHTSSFERARELLRQGDGEGAQGEIAAAGGNSADVPADVIRAVVSLFNRTGAFSQAQALGRGRGADWLEHYPTGRWQGSWATAYPRPYVDLVTQEAKRSGILPSFAYAIMREESAFDPHAVSPSRAVGLMQLIVPTAKMVAKKLGLSASEETLKNPATNVTLGCRYLGDLRSQFPAAPLLAVPSYNAGPGAPRKWLNRRGVDDFDLFVERIPYEETRAYTKRVLTSYAAYLFLYEPAALDDVLRLPLRVSGNALPPMAGGTDPVSSTTLSGADNGSTSYDDETSATP